MQFRMQTASYGASSRREQSFCFVSNLKPLYQLQLVWFAVQYKVKILRKVV